MSPRLERSASSRRIPKYQLSQGWLLQEGGFMDTKDRNSRAPVARRKSGQPAAIDRRTFLARSAGFAGAAAAGLATKAAAQDTPPAVPKWMQEQGSPLNAYGQRSKFEDSVKRYVG